MPKCTAPSSRTERRYLKKPRFLAWQETGTRWYFLVCAPVLAAAAITLAWPRLHDIRLRYEYQSLRIQQAKLIAENRSLRLSRAKLQSLVRIEAIARERLGLIDPKPEQVIWIKTKTLADSNGAIH